MRINKTLVRLISSGLLIFGAVSLITVLSTELSDVGDTVSSYQDIETSDANTLQAGTLVFTISSTNNYAGRFPGIAANNWDNAISAGTEEFYITVGEGDGSLPVSYSVTGELNPDNPTGCDQLLINAQFAEHTYTGPVTLLALEPIINMGTWEFSVSLPENNQTLGPEAICKGDIVFSASIANINPTLSNTYSDKKRYAFELKNWPAPAPEEPAASTVTTPPPEPVVLGENNAVIVNEPIVADLPTEVLPAEVTPTEITVEPPIEDTPAVESESPPVF